MSENDIFQAHIAATHRIQHTGMGWR